MLKKAEQRTASTSKYSESLFMRVEEGTIARIDAVLERFEDRSHMLREAIEREIRVPLHYAGLTDAAQYSVEDGALQPVALDRTETAVIKVRIPPLGRTWLLFTAASR